MTHPKSRTSKHRRRRPAQPIASAPSLVILVAPDGKEFSVDERAARMATAVDRSLDCTPTPADGAPRKIPVENVDAKSLELVIEYCTHYIGAIPYRETPVVRGEKIPEWDQEFLDRIATNDGDNVLFALYNAAFHMDAKRLLRSGSHYISNIISSCKTTENMRKRFNIKNDFTEAEEAEMRAENTMRRALREE
ncbi:hypothetical protein PRIPAC_72945 [Pristionchus pacificus]|uniref:Skp1-related protein n=1 Tax=Pristionchus pacificus TaxID=54126 RepID=A0A454XR07_PRIPA|nr:hypothetical protein PRIPAC_72945 [Pristionchus pacificus]|eukprot:PDM74364.1 hypothetical protein PRIPAC_41720 [Pristionchus pacificus]